MAERYKTLIAITGSGGRESALAAAYAMSPRVDGILAFPGNDLMGFGVRRKVDAYPDIKPTNVSAIVDTCRNREVALVDVSQEDAIEKGLVDALRVEGIPVVGPTKAAGRIEWDKVFARELGRKLGLPQPRFKVFSSERKGFEYVSRIPEQRLFIKASGLAQGKGALEARSRNDALVKIAQLRTRFPEAASRFLIEEALVNDDGTPGEEFSYFVLCKGRSFKFLGAAQDNKRVFNFDEGENTGGMGCSNPPKILNPGLRVEIEDTIIQPTLDGLARENTPYTGVLYLGGMLVKRQGSLRPYVIEFNARWGDPECQVILPGIINDWFEVGRKAAFLGGAISLPDVEDDGLYRVAVTAASRGYPGDYSKFIGKRILGLSEAMGTSTFGRRIFPAAVKVEKDGFNLLADGGRLFYVVGAGFNVKDARVKAYHDLAGITIEGGGLHYRTDIGQRDMERYFR